MGLRLVDEAQKPTDLPITTGVLGQERHIDMREKREGETEWGRWWIRHKREKWQVGRERSRASERGNDGWESVNKRLTAIETERCELLASLILILPLHLLMCLGGVPQLLNPQCSCSKTEQSGAQGWQQRENYKLHYGKSFLKVYQKFLDCFSRLQAFHQPQCGMKNPLCGFLKIASDSYWKIGYLHLRA